jgi:hypothetical protein
VLATKAIATTPKTTRANAAISARPMGTGAKPSNGKGTIRSASNMVTRPTPAVDARQRTSSRPSARAAGRTIATSSRGAADPTNVLSADVPEARLTKLAFAKSSVDPLLDDALYVVPKTGGVPTK